MAHSNKDTIEIREQGLYDRELGREFQSYALYIDGSRRAVLEQQPSGKQPKFRFDPTGAFDWQEAEVWLQGLLELSLYAEELQNGSKKKARRRRGKQTGK